MESNIRNEIDFLKNSNSIKSIDVFKENLKRISKNKATKICIFCSGVYGRLVYQKLRNRLVEIEYIVDNDEKKWGDLRENTDWITIAEAGLKCVNMEQLIKDKEDTLVIVANKTPEPIVMLLKQHNFSYVITSRQLEEMLLGVEEIGISLGSLSKVNYASEETQILISLFNQKVNNICSYYETVIAKNCNDKNLVRASSSLINLPLVSVIMPLYNAEKFVRIAVDSILNQTYNNIELILIDDCSTDDTMKVVASINDSRIKMIHNECNKGISYSRNQGLIHSCGKYIAIMDDDDVSMPERIEKQVIFMEENENIGVLGGKHEIINSKGELIMASYQALNNPKYIKAMYLFRNVYANSTIMIRRQIINQYKLRFQENCLGMEDFQFWIECSKLCEMTSIDAVVLQYRDSEENESMRILNSGLANKRAKLYAKLQEDSLRKSGFELSEDQLFILTKTMAEFDGHCDSILELSQFYQALCEMIRQAQDKNFDNVYEIKILCKKLFREKWQIFDINLLWE